MTYNQMEFNGFSRRLYQVIISQSGLPRSPDIYQPFKSDNGIKVGSYVLPDNGYDFDDYDSVMDLCNELCSIILERNPSLHPDEIQVKPY